MLKSIILAGALALATTGGAFAQSAHDWSGFYAGAHVGGGWGGETDNLSDTLVTTAPPPPPVIPGGGEGNPVTPEEYCENTQGGVYIPPSVAYPDGQCITTDMGDAFDIDGAVGGAHVGFNAQHGSFVFGVEGSADGSSVGGDHGHTGLLAVGTQTVPFSGTISFEQEWQASLVGRVGVAFDRLLFYGLGGVAISEGKSEFSGTYTTLGASDVEASDTQTHLGWVVGVGAEYAIGENWSVRLEGRYAKFEGEDYELDLYPGAAPAEVDVDFDVVTVTAGVSFSF